jgi:tRNA(adenine34) deaminase
MNIDIQYLDILKEKAKEAFDNKEIPVSCIIVNSSTGEIISQGINDRQSTNNVLGHAEIRAIIEAEKKIKDWRLDGYYMVVTLEPCDMCNMVIKESRLDKIIYLLPKKNTDSSVVDLGNKYLLEGYEEYKQYFYQLLTDFFDNMR